ncbi:MAG: ABC transporter ATP-binding protein [Anaerolineaceae bacterium]|nr:ABC transporter ATP-binding protein [Anaerolineaceae bacterium]
MSEEKQWVIETHDLDRVYGDGDVIRALDHVNIQIAQGELVSVMGPSGSGKSTLLNVIGALDRPTSGEIFVNGQNLAEITDLDHFRARSVGFIFQLHNLLPTMTAKENVEIPMIGHSSAAERSARAKELLEMVDITDRMNHLPGQLSGGQRQRVAIARALANKPPLVLADEPTGSLDTTNGQELMRLLRDLNENSGTTFVVVTHDPAVARQTKRVLVMRDGKIEREDFIGSADEEDLKMWRHSALGKQVIKGQSNDLLEKLSTKELEMLKKTLSIANGK